MLVLHPLGAFTVAMQIYRHKRRRCGWWVPLFFCGGAVGLGGPGNTLCVHLIPLHKAVLDTKSNLMDETNVRQAA